MSRIFRMDFFFGDQDITFEKIVLFLKLLGRAGEGPNPRAFTFPGGSTHSSNNKVRRLRNGSEVPVLILR